MNYPSTSNNETEELRRQNLMLYDVINELKQELSNERLEKQQFLENFNRLKEELQQVKMQLESANQQSVPKLSIGGNSVGLTSSTKHIESSRSAKRSSREAKEYTIGEIYPDIRNNPVVKYVLLKKRSVQSNVEGGRSDDNEGQQPSCKSKKLQTLRALRRVANQEQEREQPNLPLPIRTMRPGRNVGYD